MLRYLNGIIRISGRRYNNRAWIRLQLLFCVSKNKTIFSSHLFPPSTLPFSTHSLSSILSLSMYCRAGLFGMPSRLVVRNTPIGVALFRRFARWFIGDVIARRGSVIRQLSRRKLSFEHVSPVTYTDLFIELCLSIFFLKPEKGRRCEFRRCLPARCGRRTVTFPTAAENW